MCKPCLRHVYFLCILQNEQGAVKSILQLDDVSEMFGQVDSGSLVQEVQ